jgi:hypothetical protein
MLRQLQMVLVFVLTIIAAGLGHAAEPPEFSRTPRENEEQVLVISKLSQAPTIDGDIADATWGQATVVKSFWLGGTVETAQDQTVAWVGFDDDNLYVAWACQDKKVAATAAARDDNAIWKQDCVELFVSPERDAATERQFILSPVGSMFDRRGGEGFGPGGKGWNPAWTGAVQKQLWGYTAEMSIPLAELADIKKHPIQRGTTWTLKLTRHDVGEHTGTRTSSWTRISRTTSDRNALGRLVFLDRNLMLNGDAETVDAQQQLPGWRVDASQMEVTVAASTQEKTQGQQSAAVRVAGRKVEGANGRVTLGIETIPAQPVETTYAFTADIKAESPDETLVAYLVAFQEGKSQQISFKHNAGWQKVRTLITALPGETVKAPILQCGPVAGLSKKTEGGGVVYIDNVRIEIVDIQEVGLDPDSVCLTGNAVDAFRTRNQRIDGTYTYNEPMVEDTWFPHYFLPGTGPSQDYGLYRGDIPFNKGLITDGHIATTVHWPMFWEGHHGHDIVFDLKQPYQITRVVVKTAGPGQRLTHLWLKSPGETVYTRVASVPDLVAFKTQGVAMEELPHHDQRVFNDVNQAARWVRVQADVRGPGQLCEIEVWGKPIADGAGTPKRVAYLQSGGATPIANPVGTPEPEREVPPLFPVARELKLQGPAVALPDGLVIHYEPASSERARITAEVLRDELKACFGLNSTIAPADGKSKATILVGEASNSPQTAAALKSLGQSVTAKSPGPEGYVLATHDGRIVIAGSDERGAFYGTQSLLTLTRTAAAGRWEVPGVTVRDWPAMPIRIIEGRAVPSQNLVRALARFRVRYYTAKQINLTQAAEHDAFAQRYFVSFIPFLDFNSTVLQTDPTLTERPSSERLEDVPQDSRRNANPGHPRTWEIYFSVLDKWLPKFHGDIVYIGMDETHHYSAGSRWNVSPESRALNMSAGPLLAYTLNKIDKKAKEYGKRVFMHDTPFCRDWTLSYDGDPDPDWSKAIPHLPKDIMFNVWHWNKKWVLDRLGAKYGYTLVYLCTGDRDWRPVENMDPNEDYPPTEFPGYFQGMNNYMAESSFTASKLLETVNVAWNPEAIRPKDPRANAITSRYVMLWNQIHLGETIPPSLVAQPSDFKPVDIAKAANRSRIDEVAYDGQGWVDMGPNVDLRALKSGDINLAGIPFRIIDESANSGQSLVMVHNARYTDRTLPASVEIDTKDLKAASLVFLHCLDNAPGWNYLRRRELAGYYFMVYADGTYSRWELKYGTSIGTWDGQHYPWEYAPGGDTMPYGQLAWSGQTQSGLTAKLYTTEWVNPKPDVPIRKIILRSTVEPTNMNPMLLAVTAVDPRLGTTLDEKLPSVDMLKPVAPVGVAIDLANGKDESELRYIAPDGTVIWADKLHNGLSERTGNAFLTNDYRSYVGLVTMDNQQAARTDVLYFTLPKPTVLTGLTVLGRFREQRKAANFAPMSFSHKVDVSDDGGKSWKEVAGTDFSTPEETGAQWIALPDKPVQMLRIRQFRAEGTTDYHGYARVQLYRKE